MHRVGHRDAKVSWRREQSIYAGVSDGNQRTVRNMVFFELFLYYFSRLSMSLYLSTLFPLSFTLQEKTIRVLLIP